MTTYFETWCNSRKVLGFLPGKKKKRLSFSERVVADWNSLPKEVVTEPSMSCFKARLYAHRKNLPSIYKCISLQFAIPCMQQ